MQNSDLRSRRERKFQGAKVPGSESSLELSFPGAKVLGSERSRERKAHGAKEPGSELAGSYDPGAKRLGTETLSSALTGAYVNAINSGTL